ncbi:MAG: lysophospholipid acyltransferase family protein [Candidatus Omnitrophota bacterium]
MIYWLVYYTTKFVFFFFVPHRIYGRQNMPEKGGFILACNHASNLDPMLMGIVPTRRVSFFAKAELFKNSILGWVLRGCDAFPVRRGRPDIGALKESVRRLRSGRPLVFFPQGTRSANGNSKRVFPGVGFLAGKSGVPVVPVFISGSDRALPRGAKFPRRVPIRIYVGHPVHFPPETSYEDISHSVMDHIHALAPTRDG